MAKRAAESIRYIDCMCIDLVSKFEHVLFSMLSCLFSRLVKGITRSIVKACKDMSAQGKDCSMKDFIGDENDPEYRAYAYLCQRKYLGTLLEQNFGITMGVGHLAATKRISIRPNLPVSSSNVLPHMPSIESVAVIVRGCVKDLAFADMEALGFFAPTSSQKSAYEKVGERQQQRLKKVVRDTLQSSGANAGAVRSILQHHKKSMHPMRNKPAIGVLGTLARKDALDLLKKSAIPPSEMRSRTNVSKTSTNTVHVPTMLEVAKLICGDCKLKVKRIMNSATTTRKERSDKVDMAFVLRYSHEYCRLNTFSKKVKVGVCTITNIPIRHKVHNYPFRLRAFYKQFTESPEYIDHLRKNPKQTIKRSLFYRDGICKCMQYSKMEVCSDENETTFIEALEAANQSLRAVRMETDPQKVVMMVMMVVMMVVLKTMTMTTTKSKRTATMKNTPHI